MLSKHRSSYPYRPAWCHLILTNQKGKVVQLFYIMYYTHKIKLSKNKICRRTYPKFTIEKNLDRLYSVFIFESCLIPEPSNFQHMWIFVFKCTISDIQLCSVSHRILHRYHLINRGDENNHQIDVIAKYFNCI